MNSEARRALRILTAALALAVGGAPAAGAGGVRLVETTPARAPEPLLPHEIARPGVAASARMLSTGAVVVGYGPWVHRLCLGDTGARERLLAGLHEADDLGQLKGQVRLAYSRTLLGCPEGAPDPAHATWLLRAALEARPGEARTILYSALAYVHPLNAPEVFEDRVPDDAVVAYHRRRSGEAARIHSARLASIVRQRLAEGDRRGLQSAAQSYARLDHTETVVTFRQLLELAPDPELRDTLWRALRASPSPEGFALFRTYCIPWLKGAIESRRARGAPIRGSPSRWGDPCARESSFLRRSSAASAEHRAPPERPECTLGFGALPQHGIAAPGDCFDLPDERGTQFVGDVSLLRWLTRLLRPHLDDAVYVERWPAVDAIARDRGPIEQLIFVNGDAVSVRLPLDANGAPDASVGEVIAGALEGALHEERLIEAYLDGLRRRFVFDSCGDKWCAAAMLEIANVLLEARRAPVRITGDPRPHGLRLRVVATAGGSTSVAP